MGLSRHEMDSAVEIAGKGSGRPRMRGGQAVADRGTLRVTLRRAAPPTPETESPSSLPTTRIRVRVVVFLVPHPSVTGRRRLVTVPPMPNKPLTRRCIHCHTKFPYDPYTFGPIPRYCSGRCRTAACRQRKRPIPPPPRSRG